MIKITMYKKIKQLKMEGKTTTEIIHISKLDYKTVKKFLQMDDTKYNQYRVDTSFRSKVFDDLKDEILAVYKANDNRKLVMSSVYDYLEEKFKKLPGNEGSLRNYIHYLEKLNILQYSNKSREYSSVEELPYGKQLQLDFGEYKLPSGLKLYIFAVVLSGSRYKYASFQDTPFKTKDVIRHLINSFKYIGGRPEELVIDQDKTLVVKEKYGDVLYTHDFNIFIEEMDLNMYVCKKADPETKGKIENTIKFVKNSFLNCRDFENIESANESLEHWLIRRANGKISQATKKVPSLEIEKERLCLKPLRSSIFQLNDETEREERKASDKARLSVKGSCYCLPQKYKNQIVQTFTTTDELYVFDIFTNEEVVKYALSLVPGKVLTRSNLDRDRDAKLQELKDTTQKLFSNKLWSSFITKVFVNNQRTVRDQCIASIKYFSNISKKEAFNNALEYCLENNTVSVSALKDTYVHFKNKNNIEKVPDPNICKLKTLNQKINKVDVDERDLDTYKNRIKELAS